MENVPLVSIIMPAYNAEKTIVESIESVLRQTYINWELILINDGSTDTSHDLMSNYDDPRIKYLQQNNKGVASARNFGLSMAKGEFVAFLDSDDLWLNTKLERSIETFERSNCDLVYSKIKIFTKTINNAVSYTYKELIKENDDYLRLLIYDYVPTLTVVVKKSVLDKIGYFDTDLNGTEDWDFWIRIAKEHKIKFIPEELAYYRYLETGLSKNRGKHLNEEFKVLKKHVINNHHISKTVYRKSLWVWNKKSFFHCIKQRNYKRAFYYYTCMFRLMPFSFFNIKIFVRVPNY